MNIKSNLKYIWLTFGVLSLVSLSFLWFGYDSQNFQNTIHFLDTLMLILSLPCGLFAVPVVLLANHYLGISLFSVEGIYLSTIFLFVLGLMQWFWIIRFWLPDEAPLQMINLLDAES